MDGDAQGVLAEEEQGPLHVVGRLAAAGVEVTPGALEDVGAAAHGLPAAFSIRRSTAAIARSLASAWSRRARARRDVDGSRPSRATAYRSAVLRVNCSRLASMSPTARATRTCAKGSSATRCPEEARTRSRAEATYSSYAPSAIPTMAVEIAVVKTAAYGSRYSGSGFAACPGQRSAVTGPKPRVRWPGTKASSTTMSLLPLPRRPTGSQTSSTR